MPDKLFLALAILAEVVATSCLKASTGFTRPLASVLAVAGYAIAFYALSLALRTIPLGVAYAVWSGVGIAALALIGWLVYEQPLGGRELVGIALILAGVLVLQGPRT